MTTAAKASVPARIAAWSVHAFTMTGVIWACLAILALMDNKPKLMWLWLAIALVVDAIDGTFARKAKVSQVVPWFDGVILDDIVDYMTWTFIPAIFMYRYLDLGPKPVALLMLIIITASSMFCYCNVGMKSEDFYFVGFPAAWNIVAIHFVILGTGPVFNDLVIIFFAILTLAPITFMHPFRVKKFMPLNIIACVAWIIATIYLLVVGLQGWSIMLGVWIASGAWFLFISGWRTIVGKLN